MENDKYVTIEKTIIKKENPPYISDFMTYESLWEWYESRLKEYKDGKDRNTD